MQGQVEPHHELFCVSSGKVRNKLLTMGRKARAKVLLCDFSLSDGRVRGLLSHAPRNQTILRFLHKYCKFTLAGGSGKHFGGE